MAQAPRAGSRKAVVYTAFQSGGINAAQLEGAKLGLKEGTVRSWCGAWAKGGVTAGKQSPARAGLTIGTNQGYLKGDPDKELFTITARGEQQSEVRWASGVRQALTNASIVEAKPKRERVRA